jgi:hypothetical protein
MRIVVDLLIIIILTLINRIMNALLIGAGSTNSIKRLNS